MFQVIVLSEGRRAGRVASGRAGFGPGGWLRAGRANHLFNWRLGPVSPPVVQSVLQPVVQSSLQPKQSSALQPVVQPLLQPTQSSVLQPFLQQPSNRSKVRSFNRSSNQSKVRSFNRWFNRPYSRSKVRSFNLWFNRPYSQSKVRSFNRWFNRPYNRSKVRSFNRWFIRPYNRRKVRSFNRSFNRRSRQSCQCTSTEVADNATRFRKNSIGNPQNLCEVTHFLYVKQNSPQLDSNLNSKCQPETTRTHRPDFEHQVYARETAKSLGILQSPIYGRS